MIVKKLTGKQFDCVIKKFTEIEIVEYYLTYFTMSKKFTNQLDIYRNTIEGLFNTNMLKLYKNDERLHDFIKYIHQLTITKRGTKFDIVTYKYLDDDASFEHIEITRKLQVIKDDDEIEIIETIEI